MFRFGPRRWICVLRRDHLTGVLPELDIASVWFAVGLPQMIGTFADPRFAVMFPVVGSVVHEPSRIAVTVTITR